MTPPAVRPRGAAAPTGTQASPPARWRFLHWLSVAVTTGVLALTAGLWWATSTVHAHTDHRLLVRQVEEAASAINNQLRTVQTELVDTVAQAYVNRGNTSAFKAFARPKLSETGPFAAISLWRVRNGHARELAMVGPPLDLVARHEASRFLGGLHPSSALYVTKLFSGPRSRFGYAEMPPGDTAGLVVYAERNLPNHRRFAPSAPSFGEFALYLGRHPSPKTLVKANGPLPIPGDTAAVTIPFGDRHLTLVGGDAGDLTGGLFGALPWIVLGVGVALAFTGGGVVEYTTRRRRLAEALAGDNERLYLAQRHIASDLQHALLPAVPTLEGMDVAVRYLPGVDGTEVGGDWYDVVPAGDTRCFVVVGDVSGRGLKAAATMASLRYAVRAYVAQGDGVEAVLAKLNGLLDVDSDHHFATVLVAEVDIPRHRVALASAGHFPPLVVGAEGATFVSMPVNAPIGVPGVPPPAAVTIDVPRRATLLAFTDGLVERKTELLDIGLERLRSAALEGAPSLGELADHILAALVPDGGGDDTLLMALEWQN